MNTKLLMTSSSLILAIAGICALFMPDVLLSMQGVVVTEAASVLVQLMGALYFGFAIMNWTAKDSAIGGIYARPVSLANFSHFFSGALLLAKNLFVGFSPLMLIVTLVYIVFAAWFYWLVFRATGLKSTS
ncbi:MAG: hypothetical protein IPJ47_12805 [Anaerolineales bacterium]|nr:hypothetical protein [Anaerolineales bacterium]